VAAISTARRFFKKARQKPQGSKNLRAAKTSVQQKPNAFSKKASFTSSG